jgi:hypothetical protein
MFPRPGVRRYPHAILGLHFILLHLVQDFRPLRISARAVLESAAYGHAWVGRYRPLEEAMPKRAIPAK